MQHIYIHIYRGRYICLLYHRGYKINTYIEDLSICSLVLFINVAVFKSRE